VSGRRERPAGPLIAALIVVAELAIAACAAAAPPPYQGLTLAAALEDLQRRGLELTFSVAVVQPSMRVEREPRGGSLRELLAQLLVPHGLAAREVGGRLVVVEAAPPDQEASGPAAAVAALTHVETVDVTPGRVSILDREPPARTALARDQAQRVPHLAEDVYRLVARLPGVAAGDVSARFHVRGGEADETLVLVDGLEVHEPFHLEDFQSVFSIVDSQAVGSLDFVPGGFTAEYGDRLSGALDITTAVPSRRRRVAGLSFVNARYLDEGTFSGGNATWLASVRRGYLDLILDYAAAEDDDFHASPTYYDALAKIERPLGARSVGAVQVLGAWDDLEYRSDEDTERARGTYGNGYVWTTLRTAWSAGLESRTVATVGRLERERSASADDIGSITQCGLCLRSSAVIADRRVVDLAGLRQDWWLRRGERRLVKWGIDQRWFQARYDYHRRTTVLAPLFTGTESPRVEETNVDLAPSGARSAAWVAYRMRLGQRLAAEAGVRWDRQSWVGAAGDEQWSPRLNLVYHLGAATTLRAAWGRYHQAQGIHQLQVEDGIDVYFPAQVAEHRVLGLERPFAAGVRVRMELYDKRLSDLRPRFENLLNPIELIPEGQFDRVRLAPSAARARGLETTLEASRPTWEGWLAYSLSEVGDLIDRRFEPRPWDQRHAVSASVSYHPGERWSVGVAGLYHSGWPTTPVTAETVTDPNSGEPTVVPRLGRRNSDRYPSYQRLDVRVARRVALRRSSLSWFVEISNVLDRGNVAVVSDFDYEVDDAGQVRVRPRHEYWMPLVPSFGLSWELP
jgi:hypothetical protein